MINSLFETYKNYVISHGKHMFQSEYDMVMATMCAYQSHNYALQHWKCMLHFCLQCPWIDIPSPESDQHSSNFSPTIRFNIYQHIAHCTVHGSSLLIKRKSVDYVRLLQIQL